MFVIEPLILLQCYNTGIQEKIDNFLFLDRNTMNYQQGDMYPERDIPQSHSSQQEFVPSQQGAIMIYVVSEYTDYGGESTYHDFAAFRNFTDAEDYVYEAVLNFSEEERKPGFRSEGRLIIHPARPFVRPSAEQIAEENRSTRLPGHITNDGNVIYQRVLENDGEYARVMVVTEVELS